MCKSIFLPLKTDSIQYILKNYTNSNTLLVFPTKANSRKAQKALQTQWSFNRLVCKSIEEFKDELFLPGIPILEDQKRYLALYSCLNNELKEFFNCKSYVDSVSFANAFFTFFAELRDENIEPASVPVLLSEKMIETSPWQDEHYDKLLEVFRIYKDYLDNRDLTDTIYLNDLDLINLHNTFEKVVFVNQVYYSGLERMMLEKLSSVLPVELLFFGDEEFFNQENLRVMSNNYNKYVNPESITISLAENELSMLQHFCEEIEHGMQFESIVYPNFEGSFGGNMLSPERFNIPTSRSFRESGINRFLNTLSILFNGIVYSGSTKLIKLNCLIEALSEDVFVSYYELDKHELMKALSYQIDQGFIYFDLGLQNCKKWINSKSLVHFLDLVEGIMLELFSVTNPTGLVNLLANYLNPESMLNDWEKTHTNALSVFFEGLANYKTIGEFPIVESWSKFAGGVSKVPKILLSLLLENLSSRKIKCQVNIAGNRIKLRNFLDTRNISYRSIAVLNMQEGLLPGKRNQPYLFTDVQRKALGMKTYELIVAREKYYFFRLLASSKRTSIYGLRNGDEGIEVSSYIDELIVHFPELKPNEVISESDSHSRNLSILTKNRSDWQIPDIELTNSFAQIPFEITDLPLYDNKYMLSFTAFSALRDCPFKYYLENICKQRRMTKRAEENFSALLFGKFVHILMSRIVKRLNETYKDKLMHRPEWLNHKYVETTINSLMNSNTKEFYGIPQSVGKYYYEEVIKPVIANSILSFFANIEERFTSLSSGMYKWIPEEETQDDLTASISPFVEIEHDGKPLKVYLVGKADLLLESDHDCIIVDYKTGHYTPFNDYQLIMYSTVYHELLKKPAFAYFWYFKDSKLKEPGTKRTPLENIISESMIGLFVNGFDVIKFKPYEKEHLDALSRYSLVKRHLGVK